MNVIVAQNQTCFLKFQRILTANIIIAKTIQAVNPISALPRKIKSKNTGANKTPILRPVSINVVYALVTGNKIADDRYRLTISYTHICKARPRRDSLRGIAGANSCVR